ncbi:hypothetical protein J1605_004825 [Eschrichtius robustus]|uniref:Secreted protein n=1 Tax=Eschrichtius robustus TaxID=9764 RepID=A0AB34HD35_ESCRO|nr:hypothetical protein J1605_004825 [Eschrichtius robustus]
MVGLLMALLAYSFSSEVIPRHKAGTGNGMGSSVLPPQTLAVPCLLRIKQVGASLVAQWLRICLPMQGTRVRALVREDPTCRGATRPVSHNY